MWQRWLLTAFLLVGTFSASAETLILIQGYQSKGADWRSSGITKELTAAGWLDGGQITLASTAVKAPAGPRFFTVELTTDAQLLRQMAQLKAHVDKVKAARPGESLILVGHSAGGVLGRLFMVQHPEEAISALITFASPHLGTESAELGLALSQSPLGWASGFLGKEYDVLGRSEGLFFDLVRERPGSLLFWLNRQPHPQARYVSVVRDGSLSWVGDLVVPAWSQDMNLVEQLRGRSAVIVSDGNHGLESKDGKLLLNILRRLRSS
ncbi:MAG: alpha/beta hydrolase [Chromatiaceae bacterium]|nr:alpha/beta hydrolase [Gammaproteobacteria bacterium]MCB1878895.1 alpha/beta hydrolase [Gammaproteobacteria bacterium]MCB1905374.1 alpha/beta hydrolase [Gammaproteobacteria bacterium]MCP5447014.1 alpha/beta hydrolase [Chromatiaceae bacterium]